MDYELTGDPLLPGQTLAACKSDMVLRTALLFDRIVVGGSRSIPIETYIPRNVGFHDPDISDDMVGVILDVSPIARIHGRTPEEDILPIWSRLYWEKGIAVVPVFSSEVAFSRQYSDGTEIAYQAAIEHIPVVDDKSLSWDRIIEFRKDKEALRKYRDLRLWLETGLKASSLPQAVDIIGQKLDDYKWAIRKHGIESKIGSIRRILGWKEAALFTTATATATLLGGPIAGEIMAGVLIGSEVIASLAETRIKLEDAKRGDNREIAILLDIQTLVK